MCTDVVGCHCPGRSEGNRTSKNPPLPLAWTVETIEPRNVNKTQTQNKHSGNHESLVFFFSKIPKSMSKRTWKILNISLKSVSSHLWRCGCWFSNKVLPIQQKATHSIRRASIQTQRGEFALKIHEKRQTMYILLKNVLKKQTNRLVEEQGWTCGRIYV